MPASMAWQRSAVRKGRIRGRETKRDRQQETCHACIHGMAAERCEKGKDQRS